jgi:RNA polymerase sigma-70 factor, ECF subfamily
MFQSGRLQSLGLPAVENSPARDICPSMTSTALETSPLPGHDPMLDAAIQAHLGTQLRVLYGDPADIKMPRRLTQLADRVSQVIRVHTEPVDQAFVDGIMASLKSLRAYAISLTRDVHQAEDLVQETVLKAISKQEKFEADTNLQAWLFTIQRNLFFSGHRKTHREVEDADGAHAATLVTVPDQEDRIVIQDLEAALAKLPREQREAVLLVGAEGMAYEEAADTLGVKVGTLKSRVNRARTRLAELMGLAGGDGIAAGRSIGS